MAIKIIKNTLVDPINKVCEECGSEFTFTYEGQPYTYINSGSGSGYNYNHEEIAKGLLDLQKGPRMEEYIDDDSKLDIDRIIEAITELEKCGKDWYVIYADDGREKEETWLMKDKKEAKEEQEDD